MAQLEEGKARLVVIDDRAQKEFSKMPKNVRNSFKELMIMLSKGVMLDQINFKKLKGLTLFEMRVRKNGQWRGVYGFISLNEIIVVKFFRKKSQLPPKKYIITALNRLKVHKNG